MLALAAVTASQWQDLGNGGQICLVGVARRAPHASRVRLGWGGALGPSGAERVYLRSSGGVTVSILKLKPWGVIAPAETA